ncbi:MAG: MBL fold metallo-hydrolase [Clostridia bacterium]|nr:MBL fold metallo-hydrolase [Clostridia bacterium]
MTIRFLGQSGYLLKTERTELLIDPYLSDSVNRVAGRPRALPIPLLPEKIISDAIVCTHNHLDHLDPDTLSRVRDSQRIITTSEGKAALSALGKHNVAVLSTGESITVGDFTLTAVYADHTVEAFGLIVEVEGATLYFSGDTLYSERLFDVAAYRPDVTFICINGKLGNMNVEEALTVAKKIGAPINIPNHYDMFASNSEDPHLFADHIDGGCILEFNREYRLTEKGGAACLQL